MRLLIPVVIVIITLLRITDPAAACFRSDDNYCAKLRDGKLVMMHNGEIMTADLVLENGTQIKTDGSIIMQDGKTIVLKDGECVSKKGKVKDGHPKKRNE